MASSVFSPLFPSLRLPATAGSRSPPAPHAVPTTDKPAPPLVAVASHRRELVLGTALSALFLHAPLPAEAREVEVGTYLPPAPANPGFVFFRATPKDTPALRATVPSPPCRHALQPAVSTCARLQPLVPPCGRPQPLAPPRHLLEPFARACRRPQPATVHWCHLQPTAPPRSGHRTRYQ